MCQVELVFLFDSSYLLDLVVSHPAAPSYLSKPPLPLTCSKYAESRKISHYASSLPPDSSLVPFALETFGAIGFQASRFLQLLISTARDTLSSSLPAPPILSSLEVHASILEALFSRAPAYFFTVLRRHPCAVFLLTVFRDLGRWVSHSWS